LNKDEQIEGITIYLRNKLRSEVNNHPFYKNILNKSIDEVKLAMIEAEAKLICDLGLMPLIESNNHLSQNIVVDD
jgi:hypothetical protein